jgi:anti-anti-sigma factor
VERHRSEGATVLVLVGEVDIGTVPTLREALGAVPDGERLVVLDLRRLSFGDSSMLSTVMASCRRLRSHGGDLRLLGARGPVRQVLQITGVVQEVELFDTLREALDAPPRSSG